MLTKAFALGDRNEAGKVELDGATYFGNRLPFSISQVVVIEVFAVGGAEIFRSQAKDVEDRIYPGTILCSIAKKQGQRHLSVLIQGQN